MASLNHYHNPLSVSMEFDWAEAANNTRKYPSVKDYYVACSNNNDKPIQLQKGLSNFSSLQLGDDRISVNETVLSEAYRLPMEEKLAVDCPSKHKTSMVRKREYDDANNKVGVEEISRMELVMKDKLIQRSSARSSPFQVRKAFKFFDRENSSRIAIEGFTKALESLGFQFSELQNLALFARYDPEYSGTIDYMNFIAKAMYYDAHEDMSRVSTSHVTSRSHPIRETEDIDEQELRILQESELKKVFSKIDHSGSGYLNRDEFEILLMALGYYANEKYITVYMNEIGTRDGKISFNNFFNWWIQSAKNTQFLTRK